MRPMDNKKKNSSTQSKDWDKSYYLGIDIIDQQHGIFFKLFDELKELNQKNDPFDKLKDVILLTFRRS
jgi:hemerythrin